MMQPPLTTMRGRLHLVRDIAKLFLGRLYEDGLGVPRDGAKAMALYQDAADKGVAWAQYRLGLGYNLGLGGLRDDAKAHF